MVTIRLWPFPVWIHAGWGWPASYGGRDDEGNTITCFKGWSFTIGVVRRYQNKKYKNTGNGHSLVFPDYWT